MSAPPDFRQQLLVAIPRLRRYARSLVFDGGTALPFIIVASLFTLATIVGWRVVHEWRGERRARTA